MSGTAKAKRKQSANLLTLLRRLESESQFKDTIRLNELTGGVEVREPFPPRAGQTPDPFRQIGEPIDPLRLLAWFQDNDVKTSKGTVIDAITLIAHDNPQHPVRLYLAGLRWDGTPRIHTLFQDYFNAEVPEPPPGRDFTDDERKARDRTVAYLEGVSSAFLIGAVARVMQPGCKLDTLPVLVGPQDFHKSQAIAALCADPSWFTDDLPADTAERDAKESLTGKWILELAEFPHGKKDIERVKAFFSRPRDRYRHAYGYSSADWPRQCVFCGTSNDLELIDPTGNRRYYPIAIDTEINEQKIVRDRDQLWAEAYQLYQAGTKWWLGEAHKVLAGEVQDNYLEREEWDQVLEDYNIPSHYPAGFSLGALMGDALGYDDPKRIPKLDQMRCVAVLKRLGYSRVRRRGARPYLWAQRARKPKP